MRLTNSMHGFFLISDVEGQLSTVEQNLSKIRQKQEASDKLIRRILVLLESALLHKSFRSSFINLPMLIDNYVMAIL
jgi:hypothetical protein